MKIFISLEITYFWVKASITKALEGKLQSLSAVCLQSIALGRMKHILALKSWY